MPSYLVLIKGNRSTPFFSPSQFIFVPDGRRNRPLLQSLFSKCQDETWRWGNFQEAGGVLDEAALAKSLEGRGAKTVQAVRSVYDR